MQSGGAGGRAGQSGQRGAGQEAARAERCPVQPALHRKNGNDEEKPPDTRVGFTARNRNGHENNPPDLTRQLTLLLSFSSGS